MEIQSRVYLRLPRQRVWWVLQLPCVADRRGDGHIRGRCSKCPRVDGLDWQMRSCSCRQFIRTGSCEDVSHTQNAQAVLIVSDPWSRQRLNTVSGMLRNTLRSILLSATTMTKASAYRASGGGLARNGLGCPAKSVPTISSGFARISTPQPGSPKP